MLKNTKNIIDNLNSIMLLFKPLFILFIYLIAESGVNIDKNIDFEVGDNKDSASQGYLFIVKYKINQLNACDIN